MSDWKPAQQALRDAVNDLPFPLSHLIPVALQRLPRNTCAKCGKRRVLFVLTVYGEARGDGLCAVCANLR